MQENMSFDNRDLDALEQALAGLRPRAANFDRDRLMFQAGRQAGRKGLAIERWTWGGAVAVQAALLLVFVSTGGSPLDDPQVAKNGLPGESPQAVALSEPGNVQSEQEPGTRADQPEEDAPRRMPSLFASSAWGHRLAASPGYSYLGLREAMLRGEEPARAVPSGSSLPPTEGPPPTVRELSRKWFAEQEPNG